MSCVGQSGPFPRVVGTKDPKIGPNFLIGSFGLSISLGVVGGREVDIIFEESGKFSGEG